jgi:hypothetical protein
MHRMRTDSISGPGARQSECNAHTRGKVHTRVIGCHQVLKMPYTPWTNYKKQGKAMRKIFLSVIAQALNQESGINSREVILVKENVVVSWLARAEQACVTVEIVIVLYWVHNIGVNDSAREAVPFFQVTVALGPREEHNFVVLRHDNKCNCRVEPESCACFCGLAVVRRRGRSLGARTRGKVDKDAGRTSDVLKLFSDNCSEFSFRDTILRNIHYGETGYRTKKNRNH